MLKRFWQRPSRNQLFYNVFEFLQLELVLPRNLQTYNFLKKSMSQSTVQSTIQSTIQYPIQSTTESTTQLTTQNLKTYNLTAVGNTFFMHHYNLLILGLLLQLRITAPMRGPDPIPIGRARLKPLVLNSFWQRPSLNQ